MSKFFTPRPLADFLLFLGGPIIWAAHFNFLYFAQNWTCSTADARPGLIFELTATAMTLAALGGIAFIIRRQWRLAERRSGRDDGLPFLRTGGIVLGVFSVLAVIWVAFPVTLLAACPG